ncbi:hypothetical protein CSUI_008469, partial [Cystoisospora suis]
MAFRPSLSSFELFFFLIF